MRVRVGARAEFVWVGEVDDTDDVESKLTALLEAAGVEDVEIDQLAVAEVAEDSDSRGAGAGDKFRVIAAALGIDDDTLAQDCEEAKFDG